MVLPIPENMQLLLGGSADAMAELPQQALALTLSDDVLEGMIESVRNGQEIQLSLGDTPSFLFADREFRISQPSPEFEYDLFISKQSTPSSLQRLPTTAMSILNTKNRNAPLRQVQGGAKARPQARPKETKQTKEDRPQGAAARAPTQAEKDQADIDALSARFHQAEADRLENSTRILEGAVEVKGGKLKAGKGSLLSRPSAAVPRSQPGSPALSGVGSPSLGPTSGGGSNAAQEKARKLRFPLIHELAARDQTCGELLPNWQGETDADFHTHLEKIAHFDGASQKWTLKQPCWKELDVYAYQYEREEDRQRAIDNAVKKYDRLRLGVSDPLWQKLLPVSERGKGVCLSKVQAAIAKGPAAAAPKISVQSPKPSSPSVDSDREDSGSSSTKRAGKVGGEPMARTNSGSKTKKISEAQAQAKRLLSSKPAKTAVASSKPSSKPSSAKTSPKVSPVKPAPKPSSGKGGRILSKEFISDSDSDSSEEVPLSKTATIAMGKKAQELKDAKASTPMAGTTPKAKPQPVERATEKPKPRDVPVPKAKPAPAKSTTATKVADSIRAPKRSRDDDDDDDSSSSGTPLSKRFKNQDPQVSRTRPGEASSVKHRNSDSSQHSRASQSSATSSSAKAKTSPVKSSPLASSPPTNASDIDAADDRDTTTAAVKKRKFESGRAEKTGKNGGGGGSSSNSQPDRYGKSSHHYHQHSSSSSTDRYERSDSSDSSLVKRAKHGHGRSNGAAAAQSLSKETREQAYRFKTFYTAYEALHRELSAHADPPEDQVEQLLAMHQRLSVIKQQIKDNVGYSGLGE